MKRRWMLSYQLGYLLSSLLLSNRLAALTLEELTNTPNLTPKRFARYFRDFEYCFHADLQPVEVFLRTKSGDCDDYAILADLVLRPRGYETRLIIVRMPGRVAHVVCYVNQEKAYLDYNKRGNLFVLQSCRPGIRAIAVKVAKSLSQNWTSASEFTYSTGVEQMMATVVKTDPSDSEPVLAKPAAPIKIDF
ncbi:MAG: transglutaminase domain-containing protein [Limisphaerales bacterium]